MCPSHNAKNRQPMLLPENYRLRSRLTLSQLVRTIYSELAAAPEVRDGMIADADEDRWALYYGVKALARELPEMRLFYNFLDEKYGEDELTFFLYCLRVVNRGVANGQRRRILGRWQAD